MKNIFKNKILILFLLFVILTISISLNCFASYDLTVQDRDNKTYTFSLSDELMTPKYFYVYYYKSTTSYRMDILGYVCSDYEFRVSYYNSNGSTHKKFVFIDGFYHDLKYYQTQGMSYHSPFEVEIDKFNKLTLNDLKTDSLPSYSPTYFDIGSFIYSNTDIKDIDGNVFFQPTPQLVGEVTIPEITQVEEIPQVVSKVLEMIIPIGLTIFGIGLLILLMRLVILRVR